MDTEVDSLSLLHVIFPMQELNRGLLHCRQILYQLSYQGSPLIGCFALLFTLTIYINIYFFVLKT